MLGYRESSTGRLVKTGRVQKTRDARELWVNDRQTQHFFERLKIPVAMQQRVTRFYAESRNQAVSRPTDCEALFAQNLVIHSGCDR